MLDRRVAFLLDRVGEIRRGCNHREDTGRKANGTNYKTDLREIQAQFEILEIMDRAAGKTAVHLAANRPLLYVHELGRQEKVLEPVLGPT